jgi:hypothetical protein
MMNNLTIIGVAIIAVGFLEIGILILLNRIKAWTIVAFGFLAIFAGAVTANLNGVTDMLLSLGGGSAFHIQRVERHVDDKAAEVQQIGGQVRALAQQVQTDAAQVKTLRDDIQSLVNRVQNSEKNVTDMRNNVQIAYQSLFDTLVFEFYTRNMFPPPDEIVKQLDRRVTLLGDFAYGSDQARAIVVQNITDQITAALKTPSPTPTPSPQSH